MMHSPPSSHGRSLIGIATCSLFLFANLGALADAPHLRVTADPDAGELSVVAAEGAEPLVTQVARPDFRPFLHPLRGPDGKGLFTESQPVHHPHQTGLYWGFTRVNGRDFFHHPGADHWRRVSVTVLNATAQQPGESVQWQTDYDLLDESGGVLLRESQIWSLRHFGDRYELDLEWTADAKQDVTLGRYDYGGLFLRMPWRKADGGRVVNSARQENRRAEGQRAVWVDVGMPIAGREDEGHIAIFDHPSNRGFPQAWRVDGQLGIGPVPTRAEDWQIPAGKSLGFRHRIVVYAGAFDDLALSERWSEFSGQARATAEWNLARQEGRAAKFLTPEEAVREMQVQDGFRASVFAAEPLITQPMAFCWDDAGRLWVAENRDYEDRRRGFSGSGESRIVILEDTDGDGAADSRKVFAEGIPFPAAIAVGMGGLWLGAPPNLLFLPDRDADDRAEMEAAEVRLTGWGILDRHETLNSFHWGPDGWLYGLQGFATPSRVGKPAGQGRIYRHGEAFPEQIEFAGETTDINGGVWRYHPTKDRFEVVAHGFSNPWGIDYDAHGQLFITACVIPHLWHVIPGGIYHRQGGTHFNAHVYNDLKTIADHRHRSAHGGARVYLSDAFPEKYHGRIFMANIHEHAVLTDLLERDGSGFIGKHGDDFLLANNAQWVGFSVEIGPSGDVYVLDWHDADICGADVLNQDTGRIFRISPVDSRAVDFAERDADLRTLTDLQLAELQKVDSAWHARRARVILQHRARQGAITKEAVEFLQGMFHDHPRVDRRLRAMWGLHVVGQMSPAMLASAIGDPEEYVRAWAIQLSLEDRVASEAWLEQLRMLAEDDPSPVVRLYLAAALQRIETHRRWPVLEALVRRSADAGDHNLPKMLWFAAEPLVVGDPDRALRLATSTEIPLLTRHIARRLADEGLLDPVVRAIVESSQRGERFVGGTLTVDGDRLSDSWKTTQLLLGLRDSLDGRFDLKEPAGWKTAEEAARQIGGESASVALELAQRFGDRSAADSMLASLRSPSPDPDQARRAIAGLAGQRHPSLPEILRRLFDHGELRIAAIRASASFQDSSFNEMLLRRYRELNKEERLEAVLALAARSGSGRELTEAIARGDVPRSDIPAYVARSLQRVVGNGFLEVWGPIDSFDANQEAWFAKYRGLLTPDRLAAADVGRGRDLFRANCQACHQLHGEGGNVGPDITGANRGNLDYLLGNILTPSAEIQEAYRMQILLIDDGRLYTGIPAEENEHQLKLRVANQPEPVVIAKSSIESRQVAAVSMMPDGLLQELSDEAVLDLFAYLQTNGAPPSHEHD